MAALALLIATIVGACGEDDDAVVRLTKVTYLGHLMYEFHYDDDGNPTGYVQFQGSGEEPMTEYTVAETDDDGNIIEFSVERFDSDATGVMTQTFDDEGRILTKTTKLDDLPDSTTTYTYDGSTVRVEGVDGTFLLELDEKGDMVRSTRDPDGDGPVTEQLESDDVPHPFTMTAGLFAEVFGTTNNVRWITDGDCEGSAEHTYEDGLLVASQIKECTDKPDLPPIEWTYEYEEF